MNISEEAGSCYGGYHTSTYEFIQKTGYGECENNKMTVAPERRDDRIISYSY